jgi:branched-chain amino acid aminotransferase
VSTPSNGRTNLIWRDGELIPWEQATLHVMSHVVHYGSSVFEGIRCYETPDGPAVFRLREHVRRLLDSCKIYRMPMRLDGRRAGAGDRRPRRRQRAAPLLPAPRGRARRRADGRARHRRPVETFLIAWRWGAYLGHEALEQGVDVCVSSWRRPAPGTLPALAKAGGNYLNSQLAKMEARADGYAEGIVLDNFGYVSEGSGENLFLVPRRRALHHRLEAGILQGITRDSVITIARDLGVPVRESACRARCSSSPTRCSSPAPPPS